MNQQPRKGLTLLQLMSLVALLGVLLTIAAALWQGPSGNGAAGPGAESVSGNAESR